MTVGHENLTKAFKRLVKEGKLSHAYLFFGEPEVGKFSFAATLANYLENGEFEMPSQTLTETLIVQPDEEGAIGISSIRGLKRFLFQTPARSSYRTAIVDNADRLTAQAQHAILKIAEEPPKTGFIILVVSNAEALLPTLQSRMQKIYFPRIATDLIVNILAKRTGLTKTEAIKIAEISFGRPGRAIKLAGGTKPAFAKAMARQGKKELIAGMVEDPELLRDELAEIMAKLAKDPVKNYKTLRSLLDRLTKISQFNTNKRLQLESALWNI